MGNDNSNTGWWAALGLAVVASIVAAIIGDLPQIAIRYFDLVQGSDFTEETQRLAARHGADLARLESQIKQLDESLQAVHKKTAMLDDADKNLDRRLATLVRQLADVPVQTARFDQATGSDVAELKLSTTGDTVAVVTAYALGITGADERRRSLGLVLTVNGQPCAREKSSPRKGEDGDLSVSAACVVQLGANRKNVVVAERTQESVRGQVHLQYVAFNGSASKLAEAGVAAAQNRVTAQGP